MRYAVVSDRLLHKGGIERISGVLDLASDKVLAVGESVSEKLPVSEETIETFNLDDYQTGQWLNDLALDADIVATGASKIALRLDRVPNEVALEFLVHRLPRLGYWADSKVQAIAVVCAEANVSYLANLLASVRSADLTQDMELSMAYASGMSRRTLVRGAAFGLGGGGAVTRMIESLLTISTRARHRFRRR